MNGFIGGLPILTYNHYLSNLIHKSNRKLGQVWGSYMVVVSTIIMRLCSNGVEDNGEEDKVLMMKGSRKLKKE